MAERVLITQSEMIERTTNSLKESGLAISDNVIRLVINQYVTEKSNALADGDQVEEDGIGTTTPTWRRVPEKFSEKGFTSKLKIDMDSKFKRKLNNKLVRDPEYKSKVNATEL